MGFEMREHLINIAKEISNSIKDVKDVRAVALGGGIVSGYADEYSDIDIYCFCEKLPEITKRKNAIERLKPDRIKKQYNNPMFRMGQDLFYYKGRAVGIDYIPIDYIAKKFSQIKDRGHLVRDDSTVVNKLVYNMALHDPKKIFAKYKKIMKRYVDGQKILAKYFWGELKKLSSKRDWAGGGNLNGAIIRNNPIWLSYQLNMYLGWYFTCLYAINDQYYHEYLVKWSYKKINDFKYKPDDCVKRLEKFAVLGNKGRDLKKKLRIFEELIKDTDTIMGKRLEG
jgi:predicted nucleotidyltransferase